MTGVQTCALPIYIALSNKIFTYLQSGLAILASDTDAQSDFMLSHPNIGFIYSNKDTKSLTSSIIRYDSDRTLLRKHQHHAYQLGQQKLNWEIEQKKLIEIVNSLNI